jgi:photosystem II stability/assembly factor-like uncharacterized protein
MNLFRRLVAAMVGLAITSSGAGPLAGQVAAPQLDFSTYFGGSDAETVTALRVDGAGNIYLAGSTRSRDLPVTTNLFSLPATNGEWGFLLKFRADRSIAYGTYLERPVAALAVDSRGDAIVGDNLAAGNRFSGPLGDAVLTKLDASGSQVIYSVRLAGSRSDQVTALEVDSADSVVVVGATNSADFPLLNPLQSTVPPGSVAGAANAFITKLDSDGRILFSTGWGGQGEEMASALAIDRTGDIVVAGTTSSSDFPTTVNAFQRTVASVTCAGGCALRRDAFLVRVSGDGRTVRYSTLFGGANDEDVTALALDQFGSPHLAGVTRSADLPLKHPLQTTCDSAFTGNGCSAYVTKLTPDGSTLQYSTYFGSRSYYVSALGRAIAALSVDRDGNLIAVGTTAGNDMPVWRAVQNMNGGGPIFKSTDDGATWTPAGAGIAGTGAWFMKSGGRPAVLYAAPLGGNLHRSDNGGASWQALPMMANAAVDPLRPSTIYVVREEGAYKSTDAGVNWAPMPIDERFLSEVAVAPSAPSNVYAASPRRVFHSANGGVTWSRILDLDANGTVAATRIQNLTIDSRNADAVHVTLSDRAVMRREAGQQWTTLTPLECAFAQLFFADGLTPAMFAISCGKVFRSVDRGVSWREVGFSNRTAASLAVDPDAPGLVYVASAHNGVYRSRDFGETWTRIREPLDQDVRTILVDGASRTIYIGATDASNAFVTQLNAAGTVAMSTYLGGLNTTGARIAIDRNGSIVVAGVAGDRFPLVQPTQRDYRGMRDAFVARIIDPQ